MKWVKVGNVYVNLEQVTRGVLFGEGRIELHYTDGTVGAYASPKIEKALLQLVNYPHPEEVDI
jgi:hypothetical protein